MMKKHKAIVAAALLLGAGTLLSGCDEDEQDRILMYQKGTYMGPQDQVLDEQQLETLRGRARQQGGL